jgi:replicative DNA helicase
MNFDDYTTNYSQPIVQAPHSAEAEAAVIGAILVSHRHISRAIELLEPDSFYNPRNKQIFESIQKLFEKNLGIDIVTVSEHLSSRGLLENVGGAFYISELANNVANAANFEDYAKIVIEKYIKRSLIEASENIIRDSRNDSTDALEEIDKAESRIFSIAEKRIKKNYATLKTLSKETYDIIKKLMKGDLMTQCVPSGYVELDHLLSGGMHNSDLIIIAARPSMGKTALALSIARNSAMKGSPVAFFSLEMSSNQLVTRLISAEAHVDQSKINKGFISHDEDRQIVEALGILADLPITVDDSASLTIMELRAKARRLKAENKIKLIIIDYLQLINSPKSESREREISMISRSLKQMAKELDIPVVALAQLNRLVENRPDKRPVLSDLRESGSIEQDADVVMFVNRPEYYKIKFFDKEQKYPTDGMAEIIIGKQRNGPTGTVRLVFVKQFARFENPSYDNEPLEEFDENRSSIVYEDNYYTPEAENDNDPGF